MEENRAVLRLSGAVVCLAIFLRLLGTGFLDPLARLPKGEQALSALIYLQTGRAVKLPSVQIPPQQTPPQTQPTQPAVPPATEPDRLTFSPSDLDYISLDNDSSYQPDLESLLLSPLNWDLTAEEPTVLIIHSHATECYTMVPGESFFPLRRLPNPGRKPQHAQHRRHRSSDFGGGGHLRYPRPNPP